MAASAYDYNIPKSIVDKIQAANPDIFKQQLADKATADKKTADDQAAQQAALDKQRASVPTPAANQTATAQISGAVQAGPSKAPLPAQPTDDQTTTALSNVQGSLQQSAPIAQNLIQDGTLGRVDATQINSAPSANMQDIIARRKALLNGMTDQQQQMLTDQQTQANNKDTQTATRQLQAAQNSAGVRGGTASAQQLQVIMQGIQANANVTRDVFLQNQQQKLTNLNSYEASQTSADSATFQKQQAQIQLQQFNLAQSAREQSAQLATALGLTGMAQTNVNTQNSANATIQAGNAAGANTGGGITVICTELHAQGLMTDDIYALDQAFGVALKPHILDGYQCWAKSIVKLMKSSKKFTQFVNLFAKPWSLSMAGQPNIPGDLLMIIGLPVCSLIGHIRKVCKLVGER